MDEDELRYRAEVPCYCGKQRGCIETFISGTGFAIDYKRLSGHQLGRDYAARQRAGSGGGELALSRYEMRLAKSLARGHLDPDVIVLGGE